MTDVLVAGAYHGGVDQPFAVSYTFGYAGVRQKAPEASGVYVIYSSSRWIHVGESDDIRRSLFRHLNESAPCMDGLGPLSFGFELWNDVDRVARRLALVAELAPSCARHVHPA
jgi:hypothetical protein